MDETGDLWTAIRGVLPYADEFAVTVAAELEEPLEMSARASSSARSRSTGSWDRRPRRARRSRRSWTGSSR